MIIIVCHVLLKTFFFLRIFASLAPIVVMLKTVMYDLRIFMLFYFILVGMFGQTFAVLGLGNNVVLSTPEDDGALRYLKGKGGKGGGGGGGKAAGGEDLDMEEGQNIDDTI